MTANILNTMPPADRSRLLGDIVTLMTQSAVHRDYQVHHVPTIVMPAIHHNQFRIYHDGNQSPIGFVSWAALSEEAEARFLDGHMLSLDEWCSGDRLYFMEFIAPFGHAQRIAADLRQRFPGQKAYAVRYDRQTDQKRIYSFYGASAAKAN